MTELEKKIREKLKVYENEYNKKLLLGSIHFSDAEINYMEQQFKAAYSGYIINDSINKDRSLFVSLYVINFVRYFYNGERYWEYLAEYFEINEDAVRNMVIQAMKRVYKERNWNFYISKRNEYVETIRMHGVLGNDPSGDRIIYVFYLVYLKDFDKNVTKEKLKRFFPYLDRVFRQVSEDKNETHLRSNAGIAYVRGQLPKSFVRAYLVNTRKVNELIESIFAFFDSLNDIHTLPKNFDTRLLNKLKQSFQDNNQHNNEYTAPYINKRKLKSMDKKVVSYFKKSTHLNIPTHFIDFSPLEKKSAEIIIYNDKAHLKSLDLEVNTGGLGWKTEPLNYIIKKNKSKIRYIIRNKGSREVIYDSKENLFQEKLISHDVSIHLPDSVERTKFVELKSGYLYSVNDTKTIKIENSSKDKIGGTVNFVMQDKTKLSVEENIYSSIDRARLLSVVNLEEWSHVKIMDNGKALNVYRDSLLFNILLRYPYDLTELEIIVNGHTLSGSDIRNKFLKDINIKNKRDFSYLIDLTEMLSNSEKNNIELYLVTSSAKGLIAKLGFHYSKENPMPITHYSFNGKYYFTIEGLSYTPKLTRQNNSLSFQLNEDDKNYELLIDADSGASNLLKVAEFKLLVLYDAEGLPVTNELKEMILKEAYDSWYLILESYLITLTKDIGINSLLRDILYSTEKIKATLKSALNGIEESYIDQFIESLCSCLNSEKGEYTPFDERFIIPYLEKIHNNKLDTEIKVLVERVFKSLLPAIEDVSLQLTFNITREHDVEKSSLAKLFYQISTHRQDSAIKIYSIASKLKMDTRQTIETIKEASKFNTSRNSMEYYEIVVNFRDLLKEKKFDLPNIYYPLFLDMLIYLAIDYNTEVVIDYMNLIEEQMHSSNLLTEDNKKYIRNRLLEMSQAADLETGVLNSRVKKQVN